MGDTQYGGTLKPSGQKPPGLCDAGRGPYGYTVTHSTGTTILQARLYLNANWLDSLSALRARYPALA